jgi:hypothetical protein
MTRATAPVWLLDIDGVVNALARGPVHGSWPSAEWAQHVVRADIPGSGRMVLPIFVAQPVLDFVTAVHAAGAAEIVWHSTWREAAVTDLAPVLGLPRFPISVAPEWTTRPSGVWWKVPAAQRVVDSGRRLVWTDDDIAVVPEQVTALADREDTLLISPDPRTGLTAEQLASIADFLEVDLDVAGRALPPRRGLLARLRRG